ncbi:hypothetical protein HC766_06615 [Candidatus Gracilibacteria bacterium]|nr:hypothetical protein [Candidatus Gracilibacteria bacterium]
MPQNQNTNPNGNLNQTSFSPNQNTPVYENQNLGQQFQNNNNVQGAYGQYDNRSIGVSPRPNGLGPGVNATNIKQNFARNQVQSNPIRNQQQQKPQQQQRGGKIDKNSREYLERLSAADLRKEVINTEIEIQKSGLKVKNIIVKEFQQLKIGSAQVV